MIDVCDPYQRDIFVERAKFNAEYLRTIQYGKHILGHIEKLGHKIDE